MPDFTHVNDMCVNDLEFNFTQFENLNKADIKKIVIMHDLENDYVEDSSQFFNCT